MRKSALLPLFACGISLCGPVGVYKRGCEPLEYAEEEQIRICSTCSRVATTILIYTIHRGAWPNLTEVDTPRVHHTMMQRWVFHQHHAFSRT